MSRSRLVMLSLALAVVGMAFGNPAARAETEEQMARDLVPAQKPLFDLGGIGSESGAAVEAWVDNPDRTYAIGERLRVFVRPRQTSYITVLNVGSSGRVAVIYPNYYQRNVRVRAGQTIRIPGEGSNWHIDVAGPPGIEVIKIIASKQPLRLIELEKLAGATEQRPIVSLDRSSDEVARDLIPHGPSKGGAILPGGVRNLLVRVVRRGGTAPIFDSKQFAGGSFGLTLRPERPVYRIGETVRVAVAVDRDCRLSLISLGTSGQALRLFPNAFQPNDLIRAGQTVLIPSLRSPVQFKARGPAGVEGLVATCSGSARAMAPSAVVEGGFATVGDVGSVTRDLVTAAGPETAVERVSGSFLITN